MSIRGGDTPPRTYSEEDVAFEKNQVRYDAIIVGLMGGAALTLGLSAVLGGYKGSYEVLQKCEAALGTIEALQPVGRDIDEIRELTAGGTRLCHEHGDVFRIVNVENDEKSYSLTGLHQR